MRESKNAGAGDQAIALKTNGNPEGKGANQFLNDWRYSEPRGVVAKSRRQILAEFFTSMLVLSAQFKFRPVIGAEYFLYWINEEWSLSLIAPTEWTDERRAGYAGRCVLQRDMTWTITPSDLLVEENAVSSAIGRFYDVFVDNLDTDKTLEEVLPFYEGGLPYYQRLYASAVSRSLLAAIKLGDQSAAECRQWSMSLPRRDNVLLEHSG